MKRIPAEKPVRIGNMARVSVHMAGYNNTSSTYCLIFCPDWSYHLWPFPFLQSPYLHDISPSKNVTQTIEWWPIDTSTSSIILENSPLVVCRSTDFWGQLLEAVLLDADKHTIICKWAVQSIHHILRHVRQIFSFIAWYCKKFTFCLWNRPQILFDSNLGSKHTKVNFFFF